MNDQEQAHATEAVWTDKERYVVFTKIKTSKILFET